MICPYCGRQIIQPEARFCDSCGIDLSNFWKTVGPLLRQLSAQQASQDEQTARALNERLKTPESMLSAAIPESKLDVVTTAKAPESAPVLARAPPETNFQLPDETPRYQEAASKSAWSFISKYFAARKKRAEETARPQMENKCKACGHINHADAAFCRSCGTPLAKSASPQAR